jgi:hypothetical protein
VYNGLILEILSHKVEADGLRGRAVTLGGKAEIACKESCRPGIGIAGPGESGFGFDFPQGLSGLDLRAKYLINIRQSTAKPCVSRKDIAS